MSVDKQKSLAAMRTFARDLDKGRAKSGNATHSETEAVQKPVEEKKVIQKPKPVVKKEAPKKTVVKKEAHIDATEKKTPEKIPAFHELEKSKKDPKPKKKIEKKKSKGITTDRPVAGGTIITDTKKEKRSFFAELGASFEHWYKDLKKSLTPKKKNTYAVAATERRKGVVQQATSKTGTIFSADNETLRQQIKERQRAEQRKREDHDDELSWSPFTETGYPLLDDKEAESIDPRVSSVAVTFKKKAAHKTVAPEPEPTPEPEVVEAKEATPEPVIKKFVEPAPEPEPIKTPEPKPTPDPVPEPEPVAETFVQEEVLDEELLVQEEVDRRPIRSLGDVIRSDTNTQTLFLVGIVVAIVILLFATYSIMSLMTQQTDTTEQTTSVEQLFPGATQKTITLSEPTFNELSQETNTAYIQNQNEGLIEYYYSTPTGSEISTENLLGIIEPQTSASFVQSIEAVRYLQTAANRRMIVLQVDDTLNALGGMLSWEGAMYADIAGLLGTTNVPPSAGAFTDVQYRDTDVRVLTFEGRTLLLYTFVDEQFIIITNDLTALNALDQN